MALGSRLSALGAAIAVTAFLASGAGDAVELPVRDAALRLLPERPATATVVVAIDEQSLHDLGAWPWPRAVLARLVDRAAEHRAKGAILDILLAEEREGDEALAASLKRLPTAAVSVLDDRGQWLLPAPTLREATTAAHGNFELDRDGIVRRLATTKQSHDRSLTALAVEAALIVTGKPVPIGRSIAPAFRTRARRIPQISAGALLRDARLGAGLRDRIVFIGPTALALGDRFLTPTSGRGLDPGVTVHAAAAESVIRGEDVRPLPPIVSGLLAGAIVLIVVQPRPSRARRLLIAGAIAAAILMIGALLLDRAQTAAPFVTLLFTTAAAAASVETAVVSAKLREHAEHRAKEAEAKRLLAHELKTPLASMRGLTQLLGGFDLSDAERQRVTSLLENEAGKLQSLVHVLLDLERLPLRDFRSETSILDLGQLVAARVDFLRASSDRTLLVSASPGLVVRADAALMERVVDNLVGNALKYTTAPIVVRVDRDGDAALLKVDDRGPGIAAADRARLFDRFYRGSTASGTTGLGLGLSLVAEIARWHGGSASVDTVPGGGSSFRLRLPLAGAAARAGAV